MTLLGTNLPKELRGRIVIIPSPDRENVRRTYRHEVIHTLDFLDESPLPLNIEVRAHLRSATKLTEAIAVIDSFGQRAWFDAKSEIVAYEGSGGAASCIGPYGWKSALEELEAVRQGLSLNLSLTLEEKHETFSLAQRELAGVLLRIMAARNTFAERVATVGPAVAIAEAIVSDDIRIDWDTHQKIVTKIEARMRAALASSKIERDHNWCSEDWNEISRLALLSPHPQLLPLVCEAISESKSSFLVDDLTQFLIKALNVDPHGLNDNVFEEVRSCIIELSSNSETTNRWLKETVSEFVRLEKSGLLRGAPYLQQDRTLEGEICNAIKHASPSQAISQLFQERYPNRDPAWRDLPAGIFADVINGLSITEALQVHFSIAEHSSSGFDVCESVRWLAFYAKWGRIPDADFERLKQLSSILAAEETDQIVKSWDESWMREYLEHRTTIDDYIAAHRTFHS